jgi:hypothetical protein
LSCLGHAMAEHVTETTQKTRKKVVVPVYLQEDSVVT